MKAMLDFDQKAFVVVKKMSQNYSQNVSKLVEHENVLIMLYYTVLLFSRWQTNTNTERRPKQRK